MSQNTHIQNQQKQNGNNSQQTQHKNSELNNNLTITQNNFPEVKSQNHIVSTQNNNLTNNNSNQYQKSPNVANSDSKNSMKIQTQKTPKQSVFKMTNVLNYIKESPEANCDQPFSSVKSKEISVNYSQSVDLLNMARIEEVAPEFSNGSSIMTEKSMRSMKSIKSFASMKDQSHQSISINSNLSRKINLLFIIL